MPLDDDILTENVANASNTVSESDYGISHISCL